MGTKITIRKYVLALKRKENIKKNDEAMAKQHLSNIVRTLSGKTKSILEKRRRDH